MVTVGNNKTRAHAVENVVVNVERLIKDAELLLANGSPGSALSLAILAFEEAGKGHIIERSLSQPKMVHSKHEFRHAIALITLMAALSQKYSIELKAVIAKLDERLRKEATTSKGRLKMPPITDALRDEIAAEFAPQLKEMTNQEIGIFGIEIRWLNHIAEVIENGGLEKLRQSGLYLDTDPDFTVASSPMEIGRVEAYRWIWAAGRVLNLLKAGAYAQSYSPLAELIAAAAAAAGNETAVAILRDAGASQFVATRMG